MSDDRIDAAFTALRERAPEPRFAPAESVRRRGRRRGHRQIAVAGIAVVGVLGGAGLAVGGPILDGGGARPAGDGATHTASGGPDVLEPGVGWTEFSFDPDEIEALVPMRLMLQPADLPPGYPVRHERRGTKPQPWPVRMTCQHFTADRNPSRASVVGWRTINYATSETATDRHVMQTVLRYQPGGAAASIVDLDAAVTACGEQVPSFRYPVLARDFAGDESRLIEVVSASTAADGHVYLVVVRVGNAVTTLHVVASLGEATARDLGAKAAQRLRT